MFRLGGLLVSAILLSANAAKGEDVVGQAKSKDGLKTTYSIANEQTTITTTASEAGSKYDAKLEGYLFPSLRKALEGMAFVTSVMQTSGEESVENSSWAEYETKKRKSHAFLKLALQSPVTLLFEIEETYRRCKGSKSSTTTESWDMSGSSSGCSKQSELTVRGPVAVYGNYASSINVDSLLRNKQELSLTLAKDYTNKDTNLVTRFQVKSVNFDEGLARFFRVFNIPVFVGGSDVGVGAGNALLEKVSPLTSRQRLMLGISRVARTANERMLN